MRRLPRALFHRDEEGATDPQFDCYFRLRHPGTFTSGAKSLAHVFKVRHLGSRSHPLLFDAEGLQIRLELLDIPVVEGQHPALVEEAVEMDELWKFTH